MKFAGGWEGNRFACRISEVSFPIGMIETITGPSGERHSSISLDLLGRSIAGTRFFRRMRRNRYRAFYFVNPVTSHLIDVAIKRAKSSPTPRVDDAGRREG